MPLVLADASHPSAPATVGELFALVRTQGGLTRGALQRATGLSRSAVGARLTTLLDAGLLREADSEERAEGAGRPPVLLRVNPEAGVVLAGAIGRSRTQVGVFDLTGGLLVTSDLEQEPGEDPEGVMPRLVEEFASLLAAQGKTPAEVMAVGLTLPGTIDAGAGMSHDSPIMPGWNGVALAPYVQALAEVPVVVENDVNGLAASERQGLLEQHRDLLVIKASTGVGAGIVAGGRLLRGALGAAGEIGHVRSRHAEGRVCRCGATGCLEAVAGGWALTQALQQQGRPVTHVRDVVRLAAEGDPEVRHLVREAGRQVGAVVAGAVNLLNPEAVVVGGDLLGVFDVFVAGLRETVYAEATAVATSRLLILPATHGDRSGIVGCATLALESVLNPRAVDARLSAR